MAFFNLGGLVAKCSCLVVVTMLAGCMGSSSNNDDPVTPQDIVDRIPDNIIPIVIENEDEIREIIDAELDGDLREEADEILDLIVAVATTTVTSTSVSTTASTN